MAETVTHGSLEAPIKVTETRTAKSEYIRWQDRYIDSKTTLCKKVKQKLHQPTPGVYIDEVLVREANGRENVFFFDVSDALNSEQKELEKAAKTAGPS